MIKGQMSIFDFISDEPEPLPEPLPCDNCIFDVAGSCAYNTRECYCVEGNKQITTGSGWVLVDGGRNLPPCTGKWQDIEVLTYYERIDSYEYEVREYKDWTFRGKDKYTYEKGLGEIVAWKNVFPQGDTRAAV